MYKIVSSNNIKDAKTEGIKENLPNIEINEALNILKNLSNPRIKDEAHKLLADYAADKKELDSAIMIIDKIRNPKERLDAITRVAVSAAKQGDYKTAIKTAFKVDNKEWRAVYLRNDVIKEVIRAAKKNRDYDQAKDMLSLISSKDEKYFVEIELAGGMKEEEIAAQKFYRTIKMEMGLPERVGGIISPSTKDLDKVKAAYLKLSNQQKEKIKKDLKTLHSSPSKTYHKKAGRLLTLIQTI